MAEAVMTEQVFDVTVVLLDGGYASTAIGPIEVFHSAGALWPSLQGEPPRHRFRVRVASIDGRPVASQGGIDLAPSCAIAAIDKTDIIVLPASGLALQDRIAPDAPLLAWLRHWHARGAYIAGVCSGVAYLAASGLLNGRRATTHWAVAEAYRQRYPEVRWEPEQFVTEDQRLLCSGGVYASIDLSLYLVEKLCGHEVALECAKSLLVSMPRSQQLGYAMLPLSRPHADQRIRQSEEHLRQHFAENVSIASLADRAGMGVRNFIRRFKAATGRVPGAYLQTLRIAAAKERLERDTESVQVVCAAIGYEDVAFFRALFKRHTGMTPVEYRRRFARMNVDRAALEGAGPPADRPLADRPLADRPPTDHPQAAAAD